MSTAFTTLAENTSDAVTRFDARLRHVYANAAAETLLARSGDALLGRTLHETGLPEDVAAEWEAALRDAFRTGRRTTVTLTLPGGTGGWVHESRLVPEATADGSPAFVIALTRAVPPERAAPAADAPARRPVDAKRAEQLTGLAEAGFAFNSTLSLDETLALVTKHARAVIGAERAATSLVVHDGDVHVGHHAAPPDATPPEEDVQRLVDELKGPVRATGVGADALPGSRTAAASGGWLAAPLRNRYGRNIGVIQLAGRAGGTFSESDEILLGEIAQTASAAIENARLHEATQEAEIRLHRQLAFTTTITDSLGEGVYAVNPHGRLIFMNPAAERMLGWREDELIGEPIHEVIHRERADGSVLAAEACPLLDVIRSGRTMRREEDAFTHRDGHLIPVAYTSSPLITDGKVTGAVVAFRDITKRKRAEEALRLYREIFASSNDAIAIIDPEGRYVEQNAAHFDLLGYPDHELADETPAVHMGEDAFQRVMNGLAEDDAYRGELTIRARSGKRLSVEVSAFSIRNDAGEVVCHVGVKRDTSERKAAEAELEAAQRQVAMSEKLSALGTLVSGVAHEIRTPLTYVSNNLYLIRARLEKAARDAQDASAFTDDVQGHLDASLEGVTRINHLVNELRRFTRLKLGERVNANVKDVVAEALNLFRSTHRGRVTVDADLKDTQPVPLDKVQVQQVVLNLMENAADAMAGGVVRVTTRPCPWGARIVIADDGPGIPGKVQEAMYDPFYTTKPEGTGLGLSIVRRIVKGHGGSVRCDTGPGGTTFTVDLPRDGLTAANALPPDEA